MSGPMIIRTAFVEARDDLQVAYRPWGSERFGGLPVIGVHGDWSTSATWTRLASELTERWMLAPDLRGRGRTRAADHGYTIAELADDLSAFLDAMNTPRVHLVGHGLGAVVAIDLAMRAPERVASLTAISPPSVDGTPADADARAQAEAFKHDARAFSRAQSALAPKAPRDMLWATLIEAGHKQRIEAAHGTIAALDEWRPGDGLARLAMARRVIDGGRDTLAGGEIAARAAEAMACARVTIPGVGHMPHLEDPEAVAEAVRAVISESGAG